MVPTMGAALASNNGTQGRDQCQDIPAFSLPYTSDIVAIPCAWEVGHHLCLHEVVQVRAWSRGGRQRFKSPRDGRIPRAQNSLILPPNSLIGMQQFPAPLRREF